MQKIIYTSNYDVIFGFSYQEIDFITKQIIYYYKNYLLELNDIEKFRKLDNIVGEYIRDTKFFKYVQREWEKQDTDQNIYSNLDIHLEKWYQNYKNKDLVCMTNTRWL